MWNLKFDTNELQNKDRLTDIQNSLVVVRVAGKGIGS